MSNKSAGATPRFRDDSAGLGRISITAEPAPRTIGNAAGSGIEPDETPFDLAELLRELDRAGATELAERLAVAKSAIHGHLTTLRDRGFVVKRSGRYELGLRFFEYGQCARSQLEIVQSGTLAVEKLEAETREMVWLLTHQNGMAIYVYGRAGDNEVSVNTILGARTHTHCNSGGGKAILANLPESEVGDIADAYRLPCRTENISTDRGQLFDEHGRIRERGHALNRSENLEGIHAVGVPLTVGGAV
jgi:IclR family acetate operon transcriptional repressor